MSQSETVQRILAAAEDLFIQNGFMATSLRSITKKAGVNLAAVNYHFGSKKILIHALFQRFMDPFCQKLINKMDGFEAANKHLSLDEMLQLLVDQLMTVTLRGADDVFIFMQLLALALNERQGELMVFLESCYGNVFQRYLKLLNRECRHLNSDDMCLRLHFMIGGAVYTVAGSGVYTGAENINSVVNENVEVTLRKMVPLIAAGLRSGC